MRKALFLDRDGVVNKEKNYLYRVDDFEFIEGVFETCKYFQNMGYVIVIITNQAGIARGIYTKESYMTLTHWMLKKFSNNGVEIQAVYYCPHHPDFGPECECRKPSPKMILNAQDDIGIDLSGSILVGDKNTDIESGINAGVLKNYLVSTGHQIEKNKFNVPILKNLTDLIGAY